MIRAQHLDGFGQMLIDEHHFATIDRIAQGLVHLERQATRQHVCLGQHAIDVVAERCTGHQRNAQRLAFVARTFGERDRDGFCVARARKAAGADAHAVLNEKRRSCGGSDFPAQRGAANPVFVHETESLHGHQFWLPVRTSAACFVQ